MSPPNFRQEECPLVGEVNAYECDLRTPIICFYSKMSIEHISHSRGVFVLYRSIFNWTYVFYVLCVYFHPFSTLIVIICVSFVFHSIYCYAVSTVLTMSCFWLLRNTFICLWNTSASYQIYNKHWSHKTNATWIWCDWMFIENKNILYDFKDITMNVCLHIFAKEGLLVSVVCFFFHPAWNNKAQILELFQPSYLEGIKNNETLLWGLPLSEISFKI